MYFDIFGGVAGGVTPDPISNSEVKPSWADGTAGEGLWESRSPPESMKPRKVTPCGASLFPSAESTAASTPMRPLAESVAALA